MSNVNFFTKRNNHTVHAARKLFRWLTRDREFMFEPQTYTSFMKEPNVSPFITVEITRNCVSIYNDSDLSLEEAVSASGEGIYKQISTVDFLKIVRRIMGEDVV